MNPVPKPAAKDKQTIVPSSVCLWQSAGSNSKSFGADADGSSYRGPAVLPVLQKEKHHPDGWCLLLVEISGIEPLTS